MIEFFSNREMRMSFSCCYQFEPLMIVPSSFRQWILISIHLHSLHSPFLAEGHHRSGQFPVDNYGRKVNSRLISLGFLRNFQSSATKGDRLVTPNKPHMQVYSAAESSQTPGSMASSLATSSFRFYLLKFHLQAAFLFSNSISQSLHSISAISPPRLSRRLFRCTPYRAFQAACSQSTVDGA